MNKTTYANFHGVVNVFLVGGFVKSVGDGMLSLRGLKGLHANVFMYN